MGRFSRQSDFILGQSIFTPEDITNPNLIVNDRPYAGWLYFGIGLIKRHKSGSIWVFEVYWSWTWVLSVHKRTPGMSKPGGMKIFPVRPGLRAGTINLKTNPAFC